MSMSEFLTILAIFLAPFFAVQIRTWLDIRKEEKNRKLDVFRKLMANRAAGLSPVFVEALNRVDIEFYGKDEKSKKVIEAWKLCHDHYVNAPPIEDKYKDDWKAWVSKKEDLLTNLLYEMALCVGYNFDKVTIKRGHYYPSGYGDLENDQMIIRKGLVNIFEKKSPFPIFAVITPLIKDKKEEEISENLNPTEFNKQNT